MFVRICRVLAALVLFHAAPVRAQSAFEGTQDGVTRQSLNLFGGQVDALAISSNGLLVAGLNSSNGLFCSTDGAETWSALPSGSDFGTVSGLALGETANTVYVIGGISLFKSSDGCQSWSELAFSSGDPQSNNFGQTLAYAHGVLLVADRNGGLARSTDNGSTFSSVTVESGVSNVVKVAASPTEDEFFLLAEDGANNALYRSADGGATWSEVIVSPAGQYRNLAVNPEDSDEVILVSNDVVLRTDDGGTTWDDVSPIGIASGTISFVTVSSVQRLYVGSSFTTNGGTTWSNINDTASSTDTELFGHIVSDTSDSNTFYMSSLRGIAKSTDNQATWSDSVEGFLGVKIYDIAQATDKNVVYMAALGGIAKTTNYLSDRTWSYPIDLTGSGNSATAVVIDPANPDNVWAGSGAGIYRSSDGGANWTEELLDSTGVPGEVRALVRTESGVLFAGLGSRDTHDGGVVTSTDNGETWSDTSLPNTPHVNALVIVGDDLYAGVGTENDDSATSRGVYKLSGGTWTQMSGDVEGKKVNDLIFNETALFAAAGDVSSGGIYQTTAEAATWQDIGSTLEESRCFKSLAFDPELPSTLFAATGCPAGNAIVYKSEDSGSNWSVHYEGLKDEAPDVMLVDDLIVGFDTGAFEFTESAGLTLSLKAKRTGKRNRKGNSVYTLTGTVQNEQSEALAGQSVQRRYKKKKSQDYSDLGQPKTTNSKGQVRWKVSKSGFYVLRLSDDSSVESEAKRVR